MNQKIMFAIISGIIILAGLVLILGNEELSLSNDPPSVSESRVFFENVNDGDTLSKNFELQFEIENFSIEKFGNSGENTGHIHLLVNRSFIPVGQKIPFSDDIIHINGGLILTLDLVPGNYTLRLQVADNSADLALDIKDEVAVTII